jgi:hypothetical protein
MERHEVMGNGSIWQWKHSRLRLEEEGSPERDGPRRGSIVDMHGCYPGRSRRPGHFYIREKFETGTRSGLGQTLPQVLQLGDVSSRDI